MRTRLRGTVASYSTLACLALAGCARDPATQNRARDLAPPRAASARDKLVQERQQFGARLFSEKPPSSLAAFYPPGERARYPRMMEELYFPLSFLRRQSSLGNWDGAAKSWGTFLERLAKVRNAVPEWEERFGTVEEWKRTLDPYFASHDAAGLEKAYLYQLRERYCDPCHQLDRLSVMARFRFPPFYKIIVPRPPGGDPPHPNEPPEGLPLHYFMWFMNSNAIDLVNYANDGNWVEAEASYRRAYAYISNLSIVCKTCHGMSERKYFIDEASLAKFRRLETLLRSKTAGEVLGEAWDDAYDNTCRHCHDVHMFPAKIQRSWAVIDGEQKPGE
jgi:hypothetical protein